MRVAAIYDIHGNLPALEAVLDEIKIANVDCIVVGGDVVAGPMPTETLSLLMEVSLPTHFIHGNSESELLRHLAGKKPRGLSERADEGTFWVSKQLSDDHKHFISQWSATYELTLDGYGKILFCHATPHSDIKVFTKLTPDRKLVDLFEGQNASLVVCGHTHMQFERNIRGLRVVNAGSVGMPFGHTGADWLLIDTDIEFKHTDYDISKAADKLRQSDYPFVEDFITNNIFHPPSEAKALEILTQLELKTASK